MDRIANIVNKLELGIRGNPRGPQARWAELGPAGVGKTEAVLRAVEYLLQRYPQKTDKKASECLIKINCGTYQEGHEIAKLIGSPPGYLGSAGGYKREKIEPIFGQKNIDAHSLELSGGRKVFFVLLDEIEKANESLNRLLLSPLDKGDLELGDNTKVSFDNAVFVFTSNLGNSDIARSKRHTIGFSPSGADGPSQERQRIIRERAFAGHFAPEMRSRMGGDNNLVMFDELLPEDLERMVERDVRNIEKSFARSGVQVTLELSNEAKSWFLRHGTDPDTGARNLTALVDREVQERLARASVDPVTRKPDAKLLDCLVLRVDVRGDEILFLEKDTREEQYQFENLPGREIWPGLKLDLDKETEYELKNKLITDATKRQVWLKNVFDSRSKNPKKTYRILLAGVSTEDHFDESHVIYVKIFKHDVNDFIIEFLHKNGRRFKAALTQNTYIIIRGNTVM